MALQEDLNQLSSLYADVKTIQDRIEVMKDEIILKFSPVEVGDRVVCNQYSHNGKQMEVKTVRLHIKQYPSDCTQFRCDGGIIKKDGSIGTIAGKHFIDIEK